MRWQRAPLAALLALLAVAGCAAGTGAAAPPAAATQSVRCGYGSFLAGHWPGGCWRPYGATSPFNVPVPAHPHVLADSAAMVGRLLGMGPIANPYAGAAGTSQDWYPAVYWSGPGDPSYVVHCLEPWGRCALEGRRVRLPARARPAAGSDGQLAVIDQASGLEYDLWQVRPGWRSTGRLVASWGGITSITGDGLGGDATAAQQGLLAGLISGPELQAGRIQHALAMTVGCTAPRYVYPASGLAADCRDGMDAPPVGQRFYLDMSGAQIERLPGPGWLKAILRALADYGAYVTDTGGHEAFSLVLESGSSYVSFGYPDPLVVFAREHPSRWITRWHGLYYYDIASALDWRSYLKAIAPP